MTPRGELLTKNVDARAIDEGWDRIRARREGQRSSKSARWMFVAVPVLAAALVIVFIVRTFFITPASVVEPIALQDGAVLPDHFGDATAHVVALDDGSRLEVDAKANLHPTPRTVVDPARVELTLESGGTTFDVKPGGPRTWIIEAGTVTVRVLGTRFRVERSGTTVDVKVERGKVSVEGANVEGGSKLLLAGQMIHVAAPASAPSPSPSTSSSSSPAPAPAPEPTAANIEAPVAPTKVSPVAPSASSPSSLAPPSSSAKAVVPSAPSTASAPSTTSTSTPAQTTESAAAAVAAPVDPMANADAARRSGRPRDAVAILSGLVDQKDGRAPLAAFTLGKVHAEDLGDPGAAAVWFERSIALGLPRGLDEEAHARVVEAYTKAGRRPEAVRAATRYEAAFPSGRHLDRVRALVRN